MRNGELIDLQKKNENNQLLVWLLTPTCSAETGTTIMLSLCKHRHFH